MFRRIQTLMLASLVATIVACSPAATPSPTATPTTAPTVAPTVAPTATPTAEPTATPTASPTAEVVLSFDQIDPEALTKTLIDNGWFADRTDNVLDSGNKQIIVSATKSTAIVSIVHDGRGGLIRVTVYDAARFADSKAQYDLGIVNGVLLGQTQGTTAVTWELTAILGTAKDKSLTDSKVFAPDEVSIELGTDAGYPDDAFVMFESAN